MKTIGTSLLLSLVAFFAPISSLLVLVGMAIVSDTIVGLYSSYKTKTPILSRKLARIVSKMFVYQGVVLLFFAMDKLIINELTTIAISVQFITTKIVSLMLVSIECYSIDEKIRNFNNGKGIQFYFIRVLKLTKTLKKEYEDINVNNGEDN